MKDEALKLALEALEAHADIGIKADKAITAVKAALAAPVQEPVQEHAEQLAKLGWQCFECPACGSEGARAFPKPAAQRQWVGLTDEERLAQVQRIDPGEKYLSKALAQLSKAIEAKLKEKNA